MKRTLDKHLKTWAKDTKRKVLLLRGARQVGKTYSVRNLGRSFPSFLEINFEEDKSVHKFFESSLSPQPICEKLAAYYGTSIKPYETILFFDEIQACPNALRSLRFFHEKFPELHVIAAGSLLEFAISELPSFGVGRISSLFLYPMSFIEFLMASGDERLIPVIEKASPASPVDEVIHEKILEKLKLFQILGGMPEVIQTYITSRDILKCMLVLEEIVTTLRDDFAKYKKRSPVLKLQETFQSVSAQAGGKFKYSKISQGNASRDYKGPLELLCQANLAYKVFHTSCRGIPLGASVKENKFKVIPLDTGIHQRLLGLNLSEWMIADTPQWINEGSITEIFAGMEIIRHSESHMHPQLYYWHRESKSSNAEVDYVIQKGREIIPLEVKAGTKGAMQSMSIFLEERNSKRGFRISQENFAAYGKMQVVPLYAIHNLMI